MSLKRNGQISPKFTQKFTPLQKTLYHHIPKRTLDFNKSIPYPFKYLAKIPISLKTLPGPHFFLFFIKYTARGHGMFPIYAYIGRVGKKNSGERSRDTSNDYIIWSTYWSVKALAKKNDLRAYHAYRVNCLNSLGNLSCINSSWASSIMNTKSMSQNTRSCTFHVDDLRWLRRTCACAQSRQSHHRSPRQRNKHTLRFSPKHRHLA